MINESIYKSRFSNSRSPQDQDIIMIRFFEFVQETREGFSVSVLQVVVSMSLIKAFEDRISGLVNTAVAVQVVLAGKEEDGVLA